MRRGDRLLYLGLLFAFAGLPLAPLLFARGRPSGEFVLEAVSEGRVIAREEIGGSRELLLRAGGGSNTLSIERGSVRMISADCPGGDCLRMAALTDGRGSIVCLPHRLIVRLRDRRGEEDEAGLDAITH